MAARYDVTCRQGQTWRMDAQVVLQDTGAAMSLVGYTAAMQVRPSAAGDLEATATVTVDTVTRLIRCELAPATTLAMTPGVYEYDLIATLPNGDKLPILYGQFVVEAGVAR